MNKSIDVLIIGGGLTGSSLMLALQGLGYSCLLVEARSFNEKIAFDFDARTLALSPSSVRILSMLEIWPLLAQHAAPIENIHVSEQQGFGITRLKGKKENPLGYVIEMPYIQQALYRLLPKDKVLAPARLSALNTQENTAKIALDNQEEISIKAQLIVAADGSQSDARRLLGLPSVVKKYHQQAIVANLELTKSHQHRAFERFTTHGPLALLPMTQQRMAMIWAMAPKEAEKYMLLKEDQFLKSLQQIFGYRLGRFISLGKRVTYPLEQVLMPQTVQWPVVFLGNAAHTLHPVAGQGFNLGLRDAAMLAQLIAEQGITKAMLAAYQKKRRHDQKAITHLTDGLVDLFTSRIPGLKAARSLGLLAMDNISALKNIVTHYAGGFAGIIPDLACEIALTSTNLRSGDEASC